MLINSKINNDMFKQNNMILNLNYIILLNIKNLQLLQIETNISDNFKDYNRVGNENITKIKEINHDEKQSL